LHGETDIVLHDDGLEVGGVEVPFMVFVEELKCFFKAVEFILPEQVVP
jgi:hypothetical protein